MKKDIFIDTNIACNFANPMDKNYKDLIAWLNDDHEIKSGQTDDRAYLVVSKKLLQEYCASFRGSSLVNAMPVLVARLQQSNRLVVVTNQQISDFKNAHFKKSIVNKMQSNSEDREHIPVVLLSERKFVLTNDGKFAHDLNLFPGFSVTCSNRPEKIPYRN